MDFCLVINNLSGGGAQGFTLRLGNALQKRGHRARIVLLENRVSHAIPPGLEIHALTREGGSIGHGLLGKRLAAFVAGRGLRRLYRRLGLGPRCVTISTLAYADEAVRRAALPNTWFRIANTLSEEVAAVRARHRRKGDRRLARYRRLYEGRNLVAVSDGVAADLRDGIGLSRARIVRIYNGYDFDAVRSAAAEPVADLPTGPYVIHVGRYVAQKRHDLLLDAWRLANLPGRLVLLTSRHPDLDAMIAARGLADRVVVTGHRTNPFPWIRAASLLALCSDREGLPNVLIEALALGVRTVSTDCPSGPREILRGDLARRLAPCGDAAAFARAMRDALAAPAPAPPLDDFSAATMAEGYESLGRVT
jgi:glycosyltransferase involved in cell wall biosynthesis